jgi:hypothetical protein
MYHGEDEQEDFLVLSGECLLLVEGHERRLRAWDFVHCPAWTEHVFVGAGDGPCAILAIGGRSGGDVIYPASELAQRHGAGVATPVPRPTCRIARAGCRSRPSRPGWPASAARRGTTASQARSSARRGRPRRRR